ncbi:MAG: MFS transporter [Clostridiales bacterium]|nr:MFS transporter [Clostridiales bacterium]
MKERISAKNSTARYGYIVLVLLCLGITMPNFAQYQITGFGKEAISRFLGRELSDSQFSLVNMSPLIPGVFLSLVSGLLVDRFGPRKVITTGVVLSALGVVLRVGLDSYGTIIASMILMGVCATFLNANGPKVLGTWFAPGKASILLGVFLAIANISMALGTGIVAVFDTVHSAFLCAAIVAVIVALLWIVFMRDNKNAPEGVKAETPAEKVPIIECIKICAGSKGVWLAAFCMMCICTATVGATQFLPTALQSRGVSKETASLCGMCITIGATIGCLISPTLSTILKQPKKWMFVGGLLAAAGAAFAWRITSVPVMVVCLTITGFLTSGFSPIINSLPLSLKEIGPRYAGTAGGFIATIQLVGNVVLPTYVICNIVGNNNYNGMFICFGALMLIFCVLCIFLPLESKKA